MDTELGFNMFYSARLKLTAWYLLIITLVSVLFSVGIYVQINEELDRVERFQELRQQRIEQEFQGLPFRPNIPDYDPTTVIQARTRLIMTLGLINLGIIIVAGGAGYFLAGRTLLPIQKMVDEQNRFIADASHELRTPLTALRAEIEASLLDKNMSVKDAKVLITSNLEEVVSLQVLSDHLLQLVHYQQGDVSVELEEVSLLQVTEEALKKVTPLAKKKNIFIANEISDMILEGKQLLLRELFVILLDNAIKYSPEQATVSLISKKQDHKVFVTVKDQGMGIDAEDLPYIFDRFYRANKSRSKTEVSGFGLGLSIAKNIVEMHGGEITVKSGKKGLPGGRQGTSFTVELPGG